MSKTCRIKLLTKLSFVIAITIILSIPSFAVAPTDCKIDETTQIHKEEINEKIEKVIDTLELDTGNQQSIWTQNIDNGKHIIDILGAEVAKTKSLLKVKNLRTNRDYIKYNLTNGGSFGINKELGIVNISNFSRAKDMKQNNSLDSIIATIESGLSLKDYIITESDKYLEQKNYYRIVWQKKVDKIGTNPYDSVWVLLDADTYQLLYLDRYNIQANSTEAKISKNEALKIALTYIDSEIMPEAYTDIKLTYSRPNGGVDELNYDSVSTVNLSYIIKYENKRITVDALTGEIIGFTTTAGQSKSFGCDDSIIPYSSTKMNFADSAFRRLGYNVLSQHALNSSISNTAIKDFWKDSKSNAFYISTHASSSVLSNNKSGSHSFFVTASDVPSGGNWDFVFLDGCNTATGTKWSSAFGISMLSLNKAFIGYTGEAYTDDMYNFNRYFWSKVGYASISDCVAYGDTAPGMEDTTPTFRGDPSYYPKSIFP